MAMSFNGTSICDAPWYHVAAHSATTPQIKEIIYPNTSASSRSHMTIGPAPGGGKRVTFGTTAKGMTAVYESSANNAQTVVNALKAFEKNQTVGSLVWIDARGTSTWTNCRVVPGSLRFGEAFITAAPTRYVVPFEITFMEYSE